MIINLTRAILAASVACTGLAGAAYAANPTGDEMAAAREWNKSHLQAGAASEVPFSFVVDGKPSSDLLKTWKSSYAAKSLDSQRTEQVVTYLDPETGLQLRYVAVAYNDFPTIEWTLYFKNTGSVDTPIIESIHALDASFRRTEGGEFILHRMRGDTASRTSYGPVEMTLEPSSTNRFAPTGGRPTDNEAPYYNLELGGQGVIIAAGWPGQWAAEFKRDGADSVRIVLGQEVTHFKLLPGEEARSPMIAIQFWRGGDWVRSQNIWRRWMMAHSMPRPGGKLPRPMLMGGSSRFYEEMTKADEASQIYFIDRYFEENISLDYWWMDAGWYYCNNNWQNTGTWEVDRQRFPNGFKKISERAHSKGAKTLLWFEPERVVRGSWIAENHPDWVLFGKGDNGLLNLGNPAALSWLTNHVDRLITDNGIDLYRQDFNFSPLELWRANDTDERQGITEIEHVSGYLAYWDELRRRHPSMLIDSCASGGRRNELEAMRRSVPLWRSDYSHEPAGQQSMTHGISLWLPFHGTGTRGPGNAPRHSDATITPLEKYQFWSTVCPNVSSSADLRSKELDYAKLRKLFSQWREVSDYYYGDYYPLTPYTTDDASWIAWQFDRPETGEGVVKVFRRGNSVYSSADLRMRSLDPDAQYSITEIDTTQSTRHRGGDLMDQGLPVTIKDRPGAVVFRYRKVL